MAWIWSVQENAVTHILILLIYTDMVVIVYFILKVLPGSVVHGAVELVSCSAGSGELVNRVDQSRFGD